MKTTTHSTPESRMNNVFRARPRQGPLKTVFRQRGAINKYNEEGITLLSVTMGFEKRVRLKILSMVPMTCRYTCSSICNCQLVADRFNATPSPKYVVQGRADEDRAEFIRAFPEVLLTSLEHQDAVARWTYAERYSEDAKVAADARKLLGLALAKQRGPKIKREGDPEWIAQAHADLVAYFTGLRRCVEDVTKDIDVLSFFPDCPGVLSAIGTSVEEQLSGKFNAIAPVSAADKLLGRIVGLKESQLQAVLKRSREKPEHKRLPESGNTE